VEGARRAELVVHEFLNGPSVPIYFRAERLGDAERVLQGDEEEWSCEAEPETCNALDTYRWLVSVARSRHARELGFAFHVHSTGPFAVLVVDGACTPGVGGRNSTSARWLFAATASPRNTAHAGSEAPPSSPWLPATRLGRSDGEY